MTLTVTMEQVMTVLFWGWLGIAYLFFGGMAAADFSEAGKARSCLHKGAEVLFWPLLVILRAVGYLVP
jgi:hypothetical protein